MHLSRKALKASSITVLLVIAAAIGYWIYSWQMTRPIDLTTISSAKWSQDLQYLSNQLARRHANAFHHISRAQYEAITRQIATAIPHLQPKDIPVELSKLTAAVGDAHTFIGLPAAPAYPFQTYWFADGLRVTHVPKEYGDLIGARLLAIDGMDVAEVESRLRAILSQSENESFFKAHVPSVINNPAVLHALGAASNADHASFTFAKDDGSSATVAMTPGRDRGVLLNAYRQAPISLQHADDDFWFGELPGTRTVYVAFNSYDRLPWNAWKLFGFVDKIHPDRVIIDLRYNGGGDYLQGHYFIIKPLLERPALNQAGRLFVLTGRFTFSAAMSNACQFRTETHALLVGEPPGEVPNSYQERRNFVLPNSHLTVSYSSRYYRFLPTDVPALVPDHVVLADWTSYRDGKDSALDWIMQQPTDSRESQ
jgi:hypothetical protein